MLNPRTMKQKARVMFLTLIGAILLGLAFGLLPLEEHSANAAPKEGKGGKGGNAGNGGGKEAPTANVDSFEIQDCNRFIIWTRWENMPDKKIASVDIVLQRDGEPQQFLFKSDPGHPIPSLGTAIFTLDESSSLWPFGNSTYEVTKTRFYDKRDNVIKTVFTGGTPPLTGITSRTADCG
jgi:hypothetical protein